MNKTELLLTGSALLAISQAASAASPHLPDPEASNGASHYTPHFEAALTEDATVPLIDSGDRFEGYAKAWLVSTKSGWELRYTIATNMDANAGWPTTEDITDDISKIHLHENEPGVAGPHVLNVFKAPAQDDDDLKVAATEGDFEGVWDSNDTNDDGLDAAPATEPFDKDRIAALCAGNTYVNVHGTLSNGMADSGVLRGNFEKTKVGKRFCKKALK